MQETLLRVLVVAFSLIMCPRDEPGLENWVDVTAGRQNHQESVLRTEEELEQEKASAAEEITLSGDKVRRDGMRNVFREQNQSDQPAREKDKLCDTADVRQDGADRKGRWRRFVEKWHPSVSRRNGELESGLKTSRATSKPDTNRLQSDGLFGRPAGPQGRGGGPDADKSDSGGTEGPRSHAYRALSEDETGAGAVAEWDDYLWYVWNTFSIISLVRFFRKYHRSQPNKKENVPASHAAADVTLPDTNSLQALCTKCRLTASEKEWEGEFLDGFAQDLLKTMSAIGGENGGMVIEDFQRVDGREIIVPFAPPEPYSFKCDLSNNQNSDVFDLQACGQIKLVEKVPNQNGCPCQSSDADDVVCLLHGVNEKARTKTVDAFNGPFCSSGTAFLSTSQINRWFQGVVEQAWGLISHKYQFELRFGSTDTLTVRFRSGKKIFFRMKPVVKNKDIVFFITPLAPNILDTFWTLSLAACDARLLQHFSRQLPEDSCHLQVLQIVLFLHERQTALTGGSALKGSHFKTALLHLLLNKSPGQWRPNKVAARLRDLLCFIESSLERKRLNHTLVGNPSAVIGLPAELTKAKPVNLFHPLVAHECIRRNAVMHFQEMLRNARMLIEDYATTGLRRFQTCELPKPQD